MARGIKLEATDEVHQKLWQRKKLNERRAQNDSKKVRKQFYKDKETMNEPKKDQDSGDKYQKFYEEVFKKDESTPAVHPGRIQKLQKQKESFNNKLKKIKDQKDQKFVDKEKREKQLVKQYREKRRYAHQINRKTVKGQLRMSGQIDHLLNKL